MRLYQIVLSADSRRFHESSSVAYYSLLPGMHYTGASCLVATMERENGQTKFMHSVTRRSNSSGD